MSQVSERRRLRREYLCRKCESYGYFAFFSGLIVATAGCLVHDAILYSQQGYRSYMILIVLLGGGIAVHLSSIRRVHRMLKTTPYVPPVMADTLPAAEVLVRGAEQPAILPSETLLRPAWEQETAKEELLRVASH